jgi:hypothetical protein
MVVGYYNGITRVGMDGVSYIYGGKVPTFLLWPLSFVA